MLRPLTGAVGLLAVALVTGCAGADGASPTPPPAAQAPCAGAPGASVDLGAPTLGGPTASITTTGQPLWLTLAGAGGGLFTGSRPAVAAVHLGPAETPPTYDEATSTVAPSLVEVRVTAGEAARLDLPAGTYWVWSSVDSRLQVAGCDVDSVRGTPAPPIEG